MNKRELLHNFVIVLFLLVATGGIFLSMLWRSHPENQLFYVFWNVACSGSYIFWGGFLLLFSNATKDRFIKESFLRKLMSKKEKTGNIFKPGAYGFGAFLFISGLIYMLTFVIN